MILKTEGLFGVGKYGTVIFATNLFVANPDNILWFTKCFAFTSFLSYKLGLIYFLLIIPLQIYE